jgi:hypothetical protein
MYQLFLYNSKWSNLYIPSSSSLHIGLIKLSQGIKWTDHRRDRNEWTCSAQFVLVLEMGAHIRLQIINHIAPLYLRRPCWVHHGLQMDMNDYICTPCRGLRRPYTSHPVWTLIYMICADTPPRSFMLWGINLWSSLAGKLWQGRKPNG